MNNFEMMRNRIYGQCGLIDVPLRKWTYEELSQTEWSLEFENRMRNRLIMGALRYGRIGSSKRNYNRIGGAMKRLKQYVESGNKECLVDAANMMLLEYVENNHPKAHWGDIQEDHCCV